MLLGLDPVLSADLLHALAIESCWWTPTILPRAGAA
jgi:hypothetical protein